MNEQISRQSSASALPPPSPMAVDITQLEEQHPAFSKNIQIGPAKAFLDPREHAPHTYLYRKPDKRPTINDLRSKSKDVKIKFAPPVPIDRDIGTFYGVFIPLVINVAGVIFWNRIGLMVGELGMVPSLIIIALASVLSLLTASSMCALATNGKMEGGGTYYLLSRTSGPSLGRVVGLMLVLANCLNGSVALLALAENITTFYAPKYFTGSLKNDLRVIAGACVPFAILCSPHVQYVRAATAAALLLGIITFYIGISVNSPDPASGFKGISKSTLTENLSTTVTLDRYIHYFAIITSAFSSLLSAYNFTGRLRRPEKMIPRGIFATILVAFLAYSVTTILLASCSDLEVLKTTLLSPLTKFSVVEPIGYSAIILATVQRSLGSLGAPSFLLNLLATDGLILNFSERVFKVVPLLGTIAIVASAGLDVLAPLSSVMFLSICGILHYSVFVASTSHAPGWRPSLRISSPASAISGCVLCLGLAALTNWQAALVAWTVGYAITYLPRRRGGWASVHDGAKAHRALRKALELRHVPPSPKIFRPGLLLVGEECWTLLPFSRAVVRGKGLCIVSLVVSEYTSIQEAIEIRKDAEHKLEDERAFIDVVMASTSSDALSKQFLVAGLGNMRPNTAVVSIDEEDVCDMIQLAMQAKYGVAVVSDAEQITGDGGVDIWWLSDDGGLCLLLGILASQGEPKKRVRVFALADVDAGDDIETATARMRKLLKKFRVEADIVGAALGREDRPSAMSRSLWEAAGGQFDNPVGARRHLLLADLIRENSSCASLVVVSLTAQGNLSDIEYLARLKTIAKVPGCVVFVRGNGYNTLSWEI